MKETANRGKGKMLLISAGIEIMLIICITAILVSGEMFSLYHLGYPGFRTWEDIFLLFAVGIGFAAAYKLSGNNRMVSFFVNLPNAFVTYILKYEQFPVMRVSSTIAAAVTLVLIGLILLSYDNCVRSGAHGIRN